MKNNVSYSNVWRASGHIDEMVLIFDIKHGVSSLASEMLNLSKRGYINMSRSTTQKMIETDINSAIGQLTPSVTPSARITAGGPCICRQYQTGPNGISKCVKWSPPGCGDAPFKVGDVMPTPTVTPDTGEFLKCGKCGKTGKENGVCVFGACLTLIPVKGGGKGSITWTF